jgi:hypothetical protein
MHYDPKALLRKTALRFQLAKKVVLESWTSNCECACSGSHLYYENCLELAKFEQLVREEIQRIDSFPERNTGTLTPQNQVDTSV